MNVIAGRPTVAIGDPGIQWSPISAPSRLKFTGTSIEATRSALTKAFGDFPIRLNSGNQLLVLKGMAAGAGDGSAPYDELILALTQFGTLEISEVS